MFAKWGSQARAPVSIIIGRLKKVLTLNYQNLIYKESGNDPKNKAEVRVVSKERATARQKGGPRKRKLCSPDPARKYVCPVCATKFRRSEYLKRHFQSVHTLEKSYACPKLGCNKTFSRKDNLCQHFRRHSMSNTGATIL